MSFLESNQSIVEIDLKTLRDNYRLLYSRAQLLGCQLMPVIKSDAYGHGIIQVANALRGEKIWGLGIYEVEEGEILRRAGINLPIFLLSGLLGTPASTALKFDLTVGVTSIQELKELEAAARTFNLTVPVHLKVDTGMSRFGMTPQEIHWIVANRKNWSHLCLEGLYSHLSCADEPSASSTFQQAKLFQQVLKHVQLLGWRPRFVHIANSAGLLNFKELAFNLARPGIALYGACSSPVASVPDPGLKPVMTFWSKIVHIKRLPKGCGISYGQTFILQRNSLVALVPVGYDNGYSRTLSNRAKVVVNGISCPIIGNICMKTMIIDVTHLPKVRPGDKVFLLGNGKGSGPTAMELASLAGTISYELLCLIGKLNRRKFLG